MGSFSMICSVSGLGIDHGTPVRCFLVTESPYHNDDPRKAWITRTPPIRAEYNDYGSIEEIHKDDLPIVELWLRGLSEDVVERPQGDNSYHERAIQRVMTLEEMLDGLRAQRIVVMQDKNFWHGPIRAAAKRDAWTSPDLAKVEAVIEAAHPGCVARASAEGKYVVDEPVPRMWRVRFGQYESGSQHRIGLESVVVALNEAGFAASLVAGTGRYANDAEVLVFNKPRAEGATEHVHGPLWDTRKGAENDDDKRLHVGLAMIREDVWQAITHYPHKKYVGEYKAPEHEHVMKGAYAWYGLDVFKKSVRDAWTGLRKQLLREPLAEDEVDTRSDGGVRMDEFIEKAQKAMEERRAAMTDEERAADDAENQARRAQWAAEDERKKTNPHFGDFKITSMNFSHEVSQMPGAWVLADATPGVISVGDHLSMLLADKREVPDGMLDGLAELAAALHAASWLGVVIRPSVSSGPQWPEWGHNMRFLETLVEITKKEMKEREYEYESGEPRNMGELLSDPLPALEGKEPVDPKKPKPKAKVKKKKPVKPVSKPKKKAKRAPARAARRRS